MREEDGKLVTEPARPDSLLARLASLSPLDEAFPPIDDPHPGSVEL